MQHDMHVIQCANCTRKMTCEVYLSTGSGLGVGLRAGQSPCGVVLRDALQLLNEDVAGDVGVLEEGAV